MSTDTLTPAQRRMVDTLRAGRPVVLTGRNRRTRMALIGLGLAEHVYGGTVGHAGLPTGFRLRADAAPTPQDVKADPRYWIAGPGYPAAYATSCDHGYRLTDSCPCCDTDEETDA